MKMMELSGEIADGVVLNYLVSPEYNKRAMEHLEIGASKAGRSIDEIDRPHPWYVLLLRTGKKL